MDALLRKPIWSSSNTSLLLGKNYTFSHISGAPFEVRRTPRRMREKGDRLSRQRGKGSFSGPAWEGREGRRGAVVMCQASSLLYYVPLFPFFCSTIKLCWLLLLGRGGRKVYRQHYALQPIHHQQWFKPAPVAPSLLHPSSPFLPPAPPSPSPPLPSPLPSPPLVLRSPPPLFSSCLPQVRFSSAVSLFSRKGDPQALCVPLKTGVEVSSNFVNKKRRGRKCMRKIFSRSAPVGSPSNYVNR